jgi:hypothetical protein
MRIQHWRDIASLLVGVWLVVWPFVLGFAGAATWVTIVLGLFVILSANKIARALIPMVARCPTRSNHRPDTLMQDRSPLSRRPPLATHGRAIHSDQTVGWIKALSTALSERYVFVLWVPRLAVFGLGR